MLLVLVLVLGGGTYGDRLGQREARGRGGGVGHGDDDGGVNNDVSEERACRMYVSMPIYVYLVYLSLTC